MSLLDYVRRRAAAALGGALFLLLALVTTGAPELGAAPDHAIDVVARAGASTNPFLLDDGNSGSGFVELGIEPRIWERDEKSELALQGHVRRREYLNRYGGDIEAGVAATANERVTERLTIGAQLAVDTSIVGSYNSATNGVVVTPTTGTVTTVPVINPVNMDLIDPDIGLAGTRQRRHFFQGSVSAAYQTTPKDTVEVAAGYTRAEYPRFDQASYTSRGVSVGYQRRLSPVSSAGARVSAERTKWDAPGLRATVYRPQLTYRRQLSESWYANGAVGLLFVRSTANGVSNSSTGVSADVSACRQLPRTTACLFASRDAASSGGGIGTQTSVGANISRQLGEYERLSFAASYDDVSQRYSAGTLPDATGPLSRKVRLLTTSASYERRLGERLTGGLTAVYRDLYSFGRSPKADIGAFAFLRATFGDRRR